MFTVLNRNVTHIAVFFFICDFHVFPSLEKWKWKIFMLNLRCISSSHSSTHTHTWKNQ
jgi:hypothetical protein